MLGFGSLENVVNALEIALSGEPWICGEQFTAADVYLGSHLDWGMQWGTVEKRKAFEEYGGRNHRKKLPDRRGAVSFR